MKCSRSSGNSSRTDISVCCCEVIVHVLALEQEIRESKEIRLKERERLEQLDGELSKKKSSAMDEVRVRIYENQQTMEYDLDERISNLKKQISEQRKSVKEKAEELHGLREKRTAMDREFKEKIDLMDSNMHRIKNKFEDQMKDIQARLEEVLTRPRRVPLERFADDVIKFKSLNGM